MRSIQKHVICNQSPLAATTTVPCSASFDAFPPCCWRCPFLLPQLDSFQVFVLGQIQRDQCSGSRSASLLESNSTNHEIRTIVEDDKRPKITG